MRNILILVFVFIFNFQLLLCQNVDLESLLSKHDSVLKVVFGYTHILPHDLSEPIEEMYMFYDSISELSGGKNLNELQKKTKSSNRINR